MLFLIPIILFGLTAVGLLVLRSRGMRMAYIWLLPAFITLVCWLLFLILPIPLTASVIKIPWLYSLEESGSLVFRMDSNSWGFVFLLITLVLVYFFTLPFRLEQEKRTVLWVGWMLLSISTILSFTSGNIITLILAWTLFDLVDFIFSYFILKTAAEEQSLADIFLPRILSISLLIVTIVFLGSGSDQLIQNAIQPNVYFLILFAALLRTGLLPFRVNKVAEDQSGISFEFLKKIALVLSGFSLLSHLPPNFFNEISSSLLSFIFLSLSLFFTIGTLAKQQRGIEVWLGALICLAFIGVISGTPQSLLGWAGVVVVGAGIQQFYTMRNPRFNFFALLGVVAISGLPFTIGMAALNGLSSKGIIIWEILCLPVYATLVLAFIQKIISPQKGNPSVESWYLSVYLFGIFLLALSPFALTVKNVITPSSGFENWWMGVLVVIVTLFVYLLVLRKNTFKAKLEKISNSVAPVLESLRFHWLQVVWKWLSLIITEVFSFVTQLLEGEGGVIWAMVMLALLVSIIGVGRS